MPLISSAIHPTSGAVVTALIGVSAPRQEKLIRHGFSVPPAVPVQAQLDTGASLSAFHPAVFVALGITPITKRLFLTPSTRPDEPVEFFIYHVSLALMAEGIARPFSDVEVMEADCWMDGEGIEALIGRDILDRCHFQYIGPDRMFHLAF